MKRVFAYQFCYRMNAPRLPHPSRIYCQMPKPFPKKIPPTFCANFIDAALRMSAQHNSIRPPFFYFLCPRQKRIQHKSYCVIRQYASIKTLPVRFRNPKTNVLRSVSFQVNPNIFFRKTGASNFILKKKPSRKEAYHN